MNYEALRYVIEQAPVEGAAWQVLVVIAYRADRHQGHCTANQRTIAHEARIARRHAQRVLDDLVGAGTLEIVIDASGRRSRTYRIAVPDRGDIRTPLRPVDNSVDNSVEATLANRRGDIGASVEATSGRVTYRLKGKSEGFEGQSAGAPTAAADPTADAVGGRSADHGRDWRAALNARSAPAPAPPLAAGSEPDSAEPGSEPPPAAAPPPQGRPRANGEPPRRPGKTRRRSRRARGREPPWWRCPVRVPPDHHHGGPVHVTLASTSKTVDLQVDGAHVPARIWEGHTASGVPVIAFITRITPDRPPGHPDTAEFQRDLAQVQPPSAPADAIPMRMIL